MKTMSVNMSFPEGMVQYLASDDQGLVLRQNAMILYPLIDNLTVSYGRAAEILGIRKRDLIELYSSMGIPYLTQTNNELQSDLDTLNRVLKEQK